jgi:hypothetical protein
MPTAMKSTTESDGSVEAAKMRETSEVMQAAGHVLEAPETMEATGDAVQMLTARLHWKI